MRTNEAALGDAAILDPDICKRHFTPARWTVFRQDVEWFRARMTPELWDSVMMSHGYNGTPVGTSISFPLAALGPASDPRILALVLIDSLLLAALWALVAWAFGWRTMAVGMLWWGTNHPATWSWIGGSFLRALHLFAFVGAICLAKRRLPGTAGSALGLASMLRAFPVVAAAGPLLGLVGRSWAARRAVVPEGLRRLSVGFVFTVVLLGTVSLFVPSGGVLRGAYAWRDFFEDTSTFSRTPFTNALGLKAVISFDERTRAVHVEQLWDRYPWDTWKSARVRVFAERRWVYIAIVAGFVALLLRAVTNREEWIALTLGSGLIPFVTNLPGYYYGFMLVFAFLWPRFPWVGVGLLTVSVVSNVARSFFDAWDDLNLVASIAVLLFVVLSTALVAVTGDKQQDRR